MESTKFLLLNKKMAHKYIDEWKCRDCGYADGEPEIYRDEDDVKNIFIKCPECGFTVKMSF